MAAGEQGSFEPDRATRTLLLLIDVRPPWLHKSLASGWLREHAGARARLLAFGVDRTTAVTWAQEFLAALEEVRHDRHGS